MSSTSSASGLLNRNISAATGVSASTEPGEQPGRGAEVPPHASRTAAPTVATPISACGTRIAQELSPNIRTDSAISHSDGRAACRR